MGPTIGERSFKSPKIIIISSYSPVYGEFKNLCFVSIAQRVRVSRAFFYNAVDVKEIIAILFAKPSSYMSAQLT